MIETLEELKQQISEVGGVVEKGFLRELEDDYNQRKKTQKAICKIMTGSSLERFSIEEIRAEIWKRQLAAGYKGITPESIKSSEAVNILKEMQNSAQLLLDT